MASETDPQDNSLSAKVGDGSYAIGRPQVGKVRYSHEAMIDLIVSNPGISQNAIAQYFGYKASWVSTILSSDAIQVRLAQRRAEIIDPALTLSIEERFKALAESSVTKLMEYVNRPAVECDPEVLIKAASLGAKSLGLGGHSSQPKVIICEEDRLKGLADKLTGLLAQKKTEGVLDVEAIEVKKPD